MTTNELDKIISDAETAYDGSIELAIAAHIHTPFVVAKCGGVPSFADKKKIGRIKGDITRHLKKKTGGKKAADPAK